MKSEASITSFLNSFSPSAGIILASGPQPALLSNICHKKGIKLINSERADPSHSFKSYWNGFTKEDYSNYYAKCEATVLQVDSFAEFLSDANLSNIHIIPNPIEIPDNLPDTIEKEDVILCAARLKLAQKRQDILVKAFAAVAHIIPNWKLYLVGKAEHQDKQLILDLVDDFDLSERVKLFDHTDDIKHFYLRSKIFALASLYEGFPNALAEALSYGLPSIGALDCPGTNHLIRNQSNGVLVSGTSEEELVESFSHAILDLASNSALRSEMSNNAAKSVQQYEPSNVFRKWTELLQKVGFQ